ncbi:MAG: exonuclease SbcCD subunit D C-terminal domain-containing protein [Prevotellaceae bacterium]|jgi:exonuclease SbcD|nr:exonuclease SbcCD subunit D C-terminal domain-containing protein [Prevotellaceae bacterium]
MLTIFHTADWHIGQIFYGYDRKEEHLFFFDWLKQQVKERQADVLLIAGDVFDSPNPSAESQKVYYKFLHEITSENAGLQIVIIAGNHDSAARLEAPNPLLEEMNITVKGLIKRQENGEIDYGSLLAPLKKDGETVAWCVAVPYLRQGDYPPSDSYAQGITLMYEAIYAESEKIKTNRQAVIVAGHLQAKDALISDKDRSERTVIGGLECVSAEVFNRADIAYTALGHLHKHQTVAGCENIRYAGSPLPMSFAEKNYEQGINLIELDKNKVSKIERIKFQPPVGLLSIPFEPKPLNDVLDEIENLPDGDVTFNSPYLELKVLLTAPEPSTRYRIEESLKGKAVKLACITPHRVYVEEKQSKVTTYSDLKTINPLDMAEDFFYNRHGNPMPENLKHLLQSVIRSVER